MSYQSPNAGQQYPSPRRRPTPTSLLMAAVLVVTVLASSALTVLGLRLAATSDPASTTLDARKVAQPVALAPSTGPSSAPATASGESVPSTRFAVIGPRRLVSPQSNGVLGAGGRVHVPLPALPRGTSAVMVEISLRYANAPGIVTLRTSREDYPTLRIAAAGASSSATAIATIGEDRELSLTTEGGGYLAVDLVGAFVPARRSSAGRIVATSNASVLRLIPAADGHDATVDLDRIPALRDAGQVSAIMVQFSGDVAGEGGYVAVGPADRRLNQTVYWGATSGTDRLRPGFLVIPVRDRTLHLRYHAGLELRADLVGYVTGPDAEVSTEGLVVPVPARASAAVRVAVGGRIRVPLVPGRGLAGLTPDQVSAALLSVTATGASPGAVRIEAPGAPAAGVPDLFAASGTRSALALSRVVRGSVSVRSDAGAAVIVTPRALVIGGSAD